MDKIPSFYGGDLKYGDDADGCRFSNPTVVAMNEYVKKINEGGAVSSLADSTV